MCSTGALPPTGTTKNGDFICEAALPNPCTNGIMTARPLIAEMPAGTELDVIDGKGL